MRRYRSLGLLVLLYMAFAGYAGWAFYAGSKIGSGWNSLAHAWPYLLAGALTIAVVTALFVWVAFYSERHGYDERAGLGDR